jgi:predicted nucleic acid-binding protein
VISFVSDGVFVDTNILVHAHDADAGVKRELAIEKLRHLWEADTGRLSVQVLQEFFVSEDLNDGQSTAGVRIVNPLLSA